jgi:hypothetical protein
MEMLKKFVTGVLMRERMGVDGIGHGDDGGKDVNYLGGVFEWGARVRAVCGESVEVSGDDVSIRGAGRLVVSRTVLLGEVTKGVEMDRRDGSSEEDTHNSGVWNTASCRLLGNIENFVKQATYEREGSQG